MRDPGTKHWRIDVVEAPDARGPAPTRRRSVAFAGDPTTIGVKDPVVRRGPDGWHAWLCQHHLDVPGEEDRMSTGYATSDDGLAGARTAPSSGAARGAWDARGARVTAVLPGGWFAYDARASAAENWWERTGLARAGDGGRLEAQDGEPVAAVRYLDVVALPGGGHRIFYEAPLDDESHELRTELVSRTRCQGDGLAHEVLQRGLVDLLALGDVDRAAGLALEARVAEVRRVVQGGALDDRELHDRLGALARADDPARATQTYVSSPATGAAPVAAAASVVAAGVVGASAAARLGGGGASSPMREKTAKAPPTAITTATGTAMARMRVGGSSA